MRTVSVGSAVALAIFLTSAALLSWLCLALAPIALVLFVAYPYGKRFTWLCHALLGLAQAVGPIGAWIGVTGHWSWKPVLLGLAVGLWIGGFDLIYALQDIDLDRAEGVYSLPARFGPVVALRTAAATHVVGRSDCSRRSAPSCMRARGGGSAWRSWRWCFGYEHSLVKPDDLSKVNRAFFTANGLIGIALFFFGLFDLLARGLGAPNAGAGPCSRRRSRRAGRGRASSRAVAADPRLDPALFAGETGATSRPLPLLDAGRHRRRPGLAPGIRFTSPSRTGNTI